MYLVINHVCTTKWQYVENDWRSMYAKVLLHHGAYLMKEHERLFCYIVFHDYMKVLTLETKYCQFSSCTILCLGSYTKMSFSQEETV